ncbi:MAG: hypothetical protein HY553_04490 [Elusimicrobia bacterium]|nr:hypothetical protein [Elusimicrobiota bacterium]
MAGWPSTSTKSTRSARAVREEPSTSNRNVEPSRRAKRRSRAPGRSQPSWRGEKTVPSLAENAGSATTR